MITVRHRAALFSAILATTAAVLAVSGPATAAVDGFDVKITELPSTFAAGGQPRTITVVASTDVGRDCQKVRWSMLMQVDGVELDEVKVERVEDTGSVPLQVESNGDTARLTDARLDPGELCRGRTVTARYEVSFSDDAEDGRVQFQAEAYDVRAQLLERASGTSEVVNGAEPEPSEEPSPSPSASATPGDGLGADSDVSGTPEEESAAPDPAATGIAAVPAAKGGSPSLLGAGLIVGAVFIFLGVGLLLRLRLKARQSPGSALPRRFHPAP